MAARILFYMVHWLRTIKEFQMVNVKDQVRWNNFDFDSFKMNCHLRSLVFFIVGMKSFFYLYVNINLMYHG